MWKEILPEWESKFLLNYLKKVCQWCKKEISEILGDRAVDKKVERDKKRFPPNNS